MKFLTNITGVVPVYKRILPLKFVPASATPDTVPNLSQSVRIYEGLGGATDNWFLVKAILVVENPNANPTTVQLFYSSGGNALFGSGTAVFSAALTATGASGTGSIEVSTTSFNSPFATTGIASAARLAPEWSALSGSNAALYTLWQEV